MKVYIGKISGLYYASLTQCPGMKEVHMPDFKWQMWKKRQDEFDALQRDMESVYNN